MTARVPWKKVSASQNTARVNLAGRAKTEDVNDDAMNERSFSCEDYIVLISQNVMIHDCVD